MSYFRIRANPPWSPPDEPGSPSLARHRTGCARRCSPDRSRQGRPAQGCFLSCSPIRPGSRWPMPSGWRSRQCACCMRDGWPPPRLSRARHIEACLPLARLGAKMAIRPGVQRRSVFPNESTPGHMRINSARSRSGPSENHLATQLADGSGRPRCCSPTACSDPLAMKRVESFVTIAGARQACARPALHFRLRPFRGRIYGHVPYRERR